MAQYILKDALVAEIERRRDLRYKYYMKNGAGSIAECKYDEDRDILSFLGTLEVKEVDIDKLCEFRKNIGFAYPDGASEYQKQLTCYRQGIKDAIKAQKGK